MDWSVVSQMDSNENEIYREGQWVKNCTFERFRKASGRDLRLEEIDGTMSIRTSMWLGNEWCRTPNSPQPVTFLASVALIAEFHTGNIYSRRLQNFIVGGHKPSEFVRINLSCQDRVAIEVRPDVR